MVNELDWETLKCLHRGFESRFHFFFRGNFTLGYFVLISVNFQQNPFFNFSHTEKQFQFNINIDFNNNDNINDNLPSRAAMSSLIVNALLAFHGQCMNL